MKLQNLHLKVINLLLNIVIFDNRVYLIYTQISKKSCKIALKIIANIIDFRNVILDSL